MAKFKILFKFKIAIVLIALTTAFYEISDLKFDYKALFSHRASSPPEIVVGAILPLTGDAAQYGNNDKEGIMLAINQANASGGINGRVIRLAAEDCQTEAKLAISAFNKLKAQGVNSIIDDAISTISLALVPLLDSEKTVLISTGSSNPSLSGASPFFFRVWNSDSYEGQVTAEYIKMSNPSAKLGILYINSDYGKGLYSVITDRLAGSSVKIVSAETFDKETRNFRPQISKVKKAGLSLLYLIGYASQTGPLTRQIREARISTPIIGTVAMEDPEFLKLAGSGAEGVIYPFPSQPSGSAVNEFKSAFRQAYGKEPGLLHDVGYDAANLIIKVMRDGAKNGDEIRTRLAIITDYQGASGLISFNANGDVSKPMEMKVIRHEQFEVLK
ncbi:MAG: ABC transporter substrate-binding protein [Methylococcales bacterium]|nr:ABC transporter substrate-binding protein [Methylococcales bacterium]